MGSDMTDPSNVDLDLDAAMRAVMRRLRSDGTLVVRSLEPGYRAVIRLSEAALLLGRNPCARYC